MKAIRICLLAAAFYAVLLPPVYGQAANSSIKGTVTDTSGAVLTQASVGITNLGTGEQRKLTTGVQGSYTFSALPPGEYEIKAALTGFADFTARLTLRVAQEAVIDLSMTPAQQKTIIQVIADVTPIINPESSALSDVKEVARIETLPLQTRNFLGILNFTPGVVSNNFAGQGQGYTRVSGVPGGSIDYMVDGMTASERYTNELQRLPQALPTIQEVKVSTANMNAEYSRPGMVEVVTKSGSNEFHGQLFELNQNSAYAAKSFHQQTVNHLNRNEFGGNISGPVSLPKIYDGRNRTFFFFDDEWIRQRSAGTQRYVVPMPAWKTGDFSTYTDNAGNPIRIFDPLSTRYDAATKSYVRTPFVGNKIPADRMNASGKKIASYLPDPNVNVPYYAGQNWQNPDAGQKDDRNMLTAKLDQVFGPNRLSGRYTYTDQVQFGPRYFLNPNDRLYGGHNAALSFTQLIRPNIVNEIRGGVQRFHAYRGPHLIQPAITETLGLPTYPGTVAWPGVYFGDSWTPDGYFEGIDRDNPQDAPVLTMTVANNLSWNHGRHEFKFGFFYQRNNVNTFETGQPGGTITSPACSRRRWIRRPRRPAR
jgi:hypothetical protein